jgi:hypothetical protein
MGKLVCPRCGDATAPAPVSFPTEVELKAEGDRYRKAMGIAIAVPPREPGQPTYGIMLCQSCGMRFVAEVGGEGWNGVYPIPHRPAANEIPEPVKSHFEEARLCFAVGAYVACLMMCRTTLFTLQREQKVSSLKGLKDKETISGLLYGQADQVRLWANMVGHEDILPQSVSPPDAEQLLAYMEMLLDTVYVQRARLVELDKKRLGLKQDSK